MATKKQKREAGEAKAKREAEERRLSGLAAQKAGKDADAAHMASLKKVTQEMNQKARSTLLNAGVNPSTGLVFTDEEMAEMEKKANTLERRFTFERIQAGRAGTLNEQPPFGGVDDYLDEVTVGEFRAHMDRMYAHEGWFGQSKPKIEPGVFTSRGETATPRTATDEIYGMRSRSE